MLESRIKISSIVANQLPEFVREEFPLVSEFLSQYYLSLEGQGSTLDILQNIDQYVKVDHLTNLIDSTELTGDVSFVDDTINVETTYGFPKSYGLIQVDSEIITYTGITATSFTGCIRGFSGVTSYQGLNTQDELVFEETEINEHTSGSTVTNLSVLFLKQFFIKLKKQITPGFENRDLYPGIDERIFFKQSNDFYTSKGADQSFEILFRALYGEDVEVIKPRDYLFIPSSAEFRVSRDLVVEILEGNANDLENRTLFQDQTSRHPGASGSINKVEKIVRNNKTYYVLSLDFDYDKDINVEGSVFGKFSIHPTTKVVTSVSAGDTTIDVDSTVGFPSSGTLIVDDYSDGSSIKIDYKSKSFTQFYECSGVSRSIDPTQRLRTDEFAYVLTDPNNINSKVKVRVTGVISDLNVYENPYYFEPGDAISNKNLGVTLNSPLGNNWFFNVATKYNVESASLLDLVNFTYRVHTIDDHGFSIGNVANLIFNDNTTKETNILSILNKNSFIIGGQGSIQPQKLKSIQKLISKSDSTEYPSSEIYSTNVQNVYADKNSVYVTSSSIPSYLNEPLKVTDRSITFSGTFNGQTITFADHGFLTGDSVTYIPESSTNTLNILEGVYFVKKINKDNFSLSNSRTNIDNSLFITLTGTVTNSVLVLTDFAHQELETQKLIRRITDPVTDSLEHVTLPGTTGILVNGVEISNYKSRDSIFYGDIQDIEVTSNGEDYDIINPPILQTTGVVGTGLSVFCGVNGSLERIDILDGGFDYVTNPVVTISGGNGKGAVAKPILKNINHSISFNSIQNAGLVNITNNTITFLSFHKFRDGELVIYKTDGQDAVAGLSADAQYFASVQDAYSIKLHKNFDDAILGSNAVDITGYGTGIHSFKCANPKKIISSISIINSGSGYKNRKTTTNSIGINTASNIITLKNHGYRSGEIIDYTSGTTAIGGVTDGSYFVTRIDNDKIRLSQVGIGSTVPEFYYANAEYISLTSTGSGTQTFNYPNITVEVKGEIGVSTLSGQDFNATVQPIFRGEIESVFVNDGGVGYGSSEILNYKKQPTFTLNSGSGGQLKPVINNGKIVQVLIFNSGNSYNSPPTLEVTGSGNGAILVPVISGGVITEVKVVNGGINYLEKDTSINVVSSGKNAQFVFNVKEWNVNIFERLVNSEKITDDDGVIFEGANPEYGLQYTHMYSPRKLRRSVTGTTIVNGEETFVVDLVIKNSRETVSKIHSPILGYAYDGNPIYGPYGFSSISGGTAKLLKSGYRLSPSTERPNPSDSNGNSIYPDGFFVNDYIFDGSGDLDEYNGRFCKTPEFPNGVYAYFTTVNTNAVESSGPFKNFRKPEFPYFIGNKFKSSPIVYNYDSASNQDNTDLNATTLSRNTTPYGVLKSNTEYDFIIDSNKIQKQNTIVKSTTSGSIRSVGIESGGSNYQVNDAIIFDNKDTDGFGASAAVSLIGGKRISNIDVSSSTVSNVEFFPSTSPGFFVGFATAPHSLINYDKISLSGVSTSTNIEGSFFIVGVHTESLVLALDVDSSSSTGIVTYFDVTGDLSFPKFRENDILGIGTEKVRILNIDVPGSRIRVEREYDGTVSAAHTASSLLREDSRKFTTSIVSIDRTIDFNLTRELYFDPQETLGLGTVSGVGIGHTLTFSNPGIGISSINIPTKALYLPDHGLDTGDALVYFNNVGDSIGVSTNGVHNFNLTNGQIVYAGKISNDLIGIATAKIGVGTTGSFVGINSTVSTSTLFFTGIGTGEKHSFQTQPENILKADVNKNDVTVTTGSTHGLQFNDLVCLKVFPGISTTVSVAYNDYHRRLVIDPRTFSAADVDITNNTITIQNHKLSRAQKVIHTATAPAGGLVDNEIYYVFVVSDNKIKLCRTLTDAQKASPVFVNITGTSSGTISKINPPLILEKNKTLEFDLSDSSLAFTNNSIQYSAFDFGIFSDRELKNQFYSSSATKDFEVTKRGSVGLTSDAKLTIKSTDNIPKNLYYGAVPINLILNTNIKKEIESDSENIKNYNQLVVLNNVLTQENHISGIGSTSFSFSIYEAPAEDHYVPSDGEFFYETNSLTAFGDIKHIAVLSEGRNYRVLPSISNIKSGFGTDAIVVPEGLNIGKIVKVDVQDIGFEYSVDKTLRPEAQLPQLLSLKPFRKFNSIGISSIGQNYVLAPDLVVIDGTNQQVVTDVDLNYKLGDKFVTISVNTSSLSESTPSIIPVNNTNGLSISNIVFDSSSKNVTVSLGSSFSSLEDFPFAVGETILIEGISVGSGTSVRGYNSSKYNFSLFNIIQTDPNIGGVNASITYNLSEYLASGEIPGIYDTINSVGRVIPSKHFPTFDISLIENEFNKGEIVTSQSSSGVVNSWNSNLGFLKVTSNKNFVVGENVVGSSSKSVAKIAAVSIFNAFYDIEDSSIVKKGWLNEVGFLNNSLQRLHDSDYYQYFSYALKSKVELSKWNNAVSSLNHTAGFKKFSDLVIETKDFNDVGITTNQNEGNVIAISDLISEIDLNCVNDFDLTTELTLEIDSDILSNQIIFNTRTLQDFIESIGNRVVAIDDLSTQFNDVPRPERFNSVNLFLLDEARSQKYFVFIDDVRFSAEKQLSIVTILRDENGIAYLNQYGDVSTFDNLGTFDFNIIGTEGQLLFYPTKFQFNDYNISLISHRIEDSIAGIGTTDLGDAVKIFSSTTSMPTGFSTSRTIASFSADSYTGAKIIVQYESDDKSYIEFDELSVVHNHDGGYDVDLIEYGQLISEVSVPSSAGLGTYSAYMYPQGSGPQTVNVDFHPNVALAITHHANAIAVAIGNTAVSGVGTFDMPTARLESFSTPIVSGATTISSYTSNQFDCAYCIACLSGPGTAAGIVEFNIVSNSIDAYISEFGNVDMPSGIDHGSFSAQLSGGNTELLFTPSGSSSITHITVFQQALRLVDTGNTNTVIDLDNSSIASGNGEYTGTDSDVKREFQLTHQQRPIFERYFVGSASTVVNVAANTINIPNHFFVNGEELTYEHAGAGTTQAIGIVTTTIAGIGTTDKLPETVYAIKIDDITIQLAGSAENALNTVAQPLEISSVGIGTSHSLTAKKQNSRVVLSIDNIIQSPIVSSAVTTTLSQEFKLTENTMTLSGITSIFSGNLLSIGNEIVRVDAVGVGSTNIFRVRRSWMGTGIATHPNGQLVTKVDGDYNIIDNKISFVTAPKGLTPIGTTTASPDEVDFVGISTHSTFSGRTFIRSGIPDTNIEPYENNHVFDDISSQFTGFNTSFDLKSGGSNVAGISTDNAIVLVNQIFQGPQSNQKAGNYSLAENAGITSVNFTGTISSITSDVNTSNVPLGGIIISVGSSEGFGYQPLVSAGGTAVVSSAGTITSVSIGNSGSGYRAGIQTNLSVGVQLPDTTGTTIIPIGIASISGGHVTSVAITTDRVFYAPRDISGVLYDNTTGITTVTTSTAHGLSNGEEIIVSGIAFTCDYSGSGPVNISNVEYNNVTGIMTVTTSNAHNLSTSGQKSDVLLTGIGMTCNLDGGSSTHVYPRTTDPAYCGTPVLAVNSATEFEVNVGVSTVATFYQSGGVAQPVLIAPRANNNSASGFDPASQGSNVLRVINSTNFEINTGISTRAHFYARCGTVNKPIDIVFDDPLSYSNIPLVYSSSSSSGIGSEATANIVVGQGSSIIDFEIKNQGHGYGQGEVLTIPIGGLTGIPTNPALTFNEFKVTIDRTFSDSFSSWSIGNLLVLDNIDDLFDGTKKSFQIKLGGAAKTIRSAAGSQIDVEQTLLVFINDILQVPGKGYSFNGGSFIKFAEAPKSGDTSKIIFYQGSSSVDVRSVDILETIKKGDTVTLNDDLGLQQDERIVYSVNSTDIINTNLYSGSGITTNESYVRPVKWCRQSVDRFIDGEFVTKDRDIYEPLIYPNTTIIQSVGIGSTFIFVESVRTFFDNVRENTSDNNNIRITSQDVIVGASATAIVSGLGTISSISIAESGIGYTFTPSATIANPVGLGTTQRASVDATISGVGAVSAMTITSAGTGYTTTNPPVVLIEKPRTPVEEIQSVSYTGDFGIIAGVSTTSVGVASTGIVFDFVIPSDSLFRDSAVVGTAITVSGIQTGYYFVTSKTNLGFGVTSLRQDNSVVGVGSTFLDNIYEVAAVSIAQTAVQGIGITYVAQVTVSVEDFNGLVGTGHSSFFGEYSWGRISVPSRTNANTFTAYNNGLTGVSTSPVIERTNPLKHLNYN